jgi:hypothetical protein
MGPASSPASSSWRTRTSRPSPGWGWQAGTGRLGLAGWDWQASPTGRHLLRLWARSVVPPKNSDLERITYL